MVDSSQIQPVSHTHTHTHTHTLVSLSLHRPGSLWMRKSFHLLAVLVFLPSLALSSVYLSLSSSISLFLFSALEVCSITTSVLTFCTEVIFHLMNDCSHLPYLTLPYHCLYLSICLSTFDKLVDWNFVNLAVSNQINLVHDFVEDSLHSP